MSGLHSTFMDGLHSTFDVMQLGVQAVRWSMVYVSLDLSLLYRRCRTILPKPEGGVVCGKWRMSR
jgi:hypothetical protein